jgi:hypothetical protein
MKKVDSYQYPESLVRRPKEKTPHARYVNAVAWARARNGTGWKLVLSFADRDGRDHQLLVRRSEIIRGDFLF